MLNNLIEQYTSYLEVNKNIYEIIYIKNDNFDKLIILFDTY